MSKTKNGRHEITAADIDIANASERITIWMKVSLVDAFKERAEETGTKYQALMKIALEEYLKKPPLEARIETIEKKLKIAI